MQTRTPAATAAIVLCAAIAPAAFGQFTAFTDQAAFTAAAGDVTLEDLNGLTPGDNLDPIVLSLDGFDIDATTVIDFDIRAGGVFPNPTGTTFINAQVGPIPGTNSPLTFDFDQPITAFGAFFDSPASLAGLEFFADGVLATDTTALGLGSDDTFIGFTSTTPFTSVDIDYLGPGASELFAFDDVVFAVVPEPASAGLLGVAGLALVRRRRA